MTFNLKEVMFQAVCFFGGFTLMSMGVVAAEGTNLPLFPSNILAKKRSDHKNLRHVEMNRRNPFKPVNKQKPAPKTLNASQSEPSRSSGTKNPDWQLLGVIHGQNGHRAVIQISPNERVVLQPGSELAQSGWTIKTITDKDVTLEHSSPSSSVGVSSPPTNVILAFPTIEKFP